MKKVKKTNSVVLSIRVQPKLKKAIQDKANDEERRFSDYLKRLLAKIHNISI